MSAFKEAEAYAGTSLLLCYSPCIDWGIDMAKMMEIQKMAVDCGYWPLYRYNPASIAAGDNAFSLDSKRIKSSLATYLQNENRYASLRRTNVERADYLQGEFEASTTAATAASAAAATAMALEEGEALSGSSSSSFRDCRSIDDCAEGGPDPATFG